MLVTTLPDEGLDIKCAWCSWPCSRLQGQDIVIKSRHKGDVHSNSLIVEELERQKEERHTYYCSECGLPFANLESGELVIRAKHHGRGHTNHLSVELLALTVRCQQWSRLRETAGEEGLSLLEALAGGLFKTSPQLGQLLYRIVDGLK